MTASTKTCINNKNMKNVFESSTTQKNQASYSAVSKDAEVSRFLTVKPNMFIRFSMLLTKLIPVGIKVFTLKA